MEIWKEIAGFEGLYEVSNTGIIRGIDRVIHYRDNRTKHWKGKILKPIVSKDGYAKYILMKEGKPNYLLGHRIVATTFISNPNNFPQVNHKDENKLNNSVDNLEWCDEKYNSNYGTRIERIIKTKQGGF